jgi:hypothetical protein
VRHTEGLTATFVKTAPAGSYADGGGLYLSVAGPDRRSWIFQYSLRRQAREIELGPAVGPRYLTPAEARGLAASLLNLVWRGVDPGRRRRDIETTVTKKQQKRLLAAARKRIRHLKKAYGPDAPEWWDETIQSQGGECGVCHKHFLEADKIVVDHDEATGKLRALLHHYCNSALGLICHDPWIAERCTKYLRSHSATITLINIGGAAPP